MHNLIPRTPLGSFPALCPACQQGYSKLRGKRKKVVSVKLVGLSGNQIRGAEPH
jgi:hypothetical protein